MKFFRLQKLNETGFHVHMMLPVLAIIGVVGIGTLMLRLSHAATAHYYSGPCTNSTLSYGSNGSCVRYAQSLLDGIEHYSIATHHSYRTAIRSGSGVFRYGGAYYIAMDDAFGNATQTAVHRMNGNNSLTGGTNGNSGWQTLCRAANNAGFNSSRGGAQLVFRGAVPSGNTSSPSSMQNVFSWSCGRLASASSYIPSPTTSYGYPSVQVWAGQSSVPDGGSETIHWISTNTSRCYESDSPHILPSSIPTQGPVSIGLLSTGNYRVTLTCYGTGSYASHTASGSTYFTVGGIHYPIMGTCDITQAAGQVVYYSSRYVSCEKLNATTCVITQSGVIDEWTYKDEKGQQQNCGRAGWTGA